MLNHTRNHTDAYPCLQMSGLCRNRASLLLQQACDNESSTTRSTSGYLVSIICTAGRGLVFSYMLMRNGSACHDSPVKTIIQLVKSARMPRYAVLSAAQQAARCRSTSWGVKTYLRDQPVRRLQWLDSLFSLQLKISVLIDLARNVSKIKQITRAKLFRIHTITDLFHAREVG
jgi:hypothetical protein